MLPLSLMMTCPGSSDEVGITILSTAASEGSRGEASLEKLLHPTGRTHPDFPEGRGNRRLEFLVLRDLAYPSCLSHQAPCWDSCWLLCHHLENLSTRLWLSFESQAVLLLLIPNEANASRATVRPRYPICDAPKIL